MKKKKTANAIMVAVIAVIVIGGVLVAGHIKGWFDKPAEESAMLTDVRGIVTMERDGVAYRVDSDTVLRKGDKISLSPGAEVKLSAANSYVVLSNAAKLTVEDPSAGSFKLAADSGEAFVSAGDTPVNVAFEDKTVEFKKALASLSLRTGTQTINVYSGSVDGADAGKFKEWLSGEANVGDLDIKTLNDFNIAQLRVAAKAEDSGLVPCFTVAALDQLEADRLAEIEAAMAAEAEEKRQAEEAAKAAAEAEAKAKAEAEAKAKADAEAKRKAEEAAKAEAEAKAKAQEAAGKSEEEKKAAEEAARKAEEERKAAEEAAAKEEAERKAAEETAKKAEEEKKAAEQAAQQAEQEKLYCTITIRCDTILNNMGDLNPSKAGYVPSSGVILGKVKVSFEDGETVFDVLKRICQKRGIQIEYSWTPMYGSYYIEGINHLYEFDCGPESGWMYKVNGWFPNYGCSSYNLKDGDAIVWCYTCKGLGTDVGAPAF